MSFFFLAIAICLEVVATISLKWSDGFTRLGPSAIVVAGYGGAFYFLSLAMKSIPIATAYAVWAGAGIILVLGVTSVMNQRFPDLAAIFGSVLIVGGILILNLVSKSSVH